MSFIDTYNPKNDSHAFLNKELFSDISNKLHKENPNHCLLLTGGTGSGKTTFATMLAHSFDGEPSIISVNCSDANGVDTARNIIEAIKYPPLGASVKVYILDEVQKASSGFQNALLTPMENMPGYAFFIFCTTEPEKLLDTFKRRCLVYNMPTPSVDELALHLRYIADSESIKEIPQSILREIVKRTNGSIGWSISVLESICEFPEEDLQKQLGYIIAGKDSSDEMREFYKAMLYKSWDDVRALIPKLGTNWEGMRYSTLQYMAAVLLGNSKQGIKSKASVIISEFTNSFIYNGKAGFVNACYLSKI